MFDQELPEDVTQFLTEIEAGEAAASSITVDEDGVSLIKPDIPGILSGKLYTATQYTGAKLISVAFGKISFGRHLGPNGKINYQNPLKIPIPDLSTGKNRALQLSISKFGVSRYPSNSERQVNTVRAAFTFDGDWKKGFIITPYVEVYGKNYSTERLVGWAWVKAIFFTYEKKIKGDF
jgi:hypothetical protein